MIDATALVRLYARRQLHRVAEGDPAAAQERTLRRLLARAAATRFGRDHDFARLGSRADYCGAVKLRRYEDFWSEYWRAVFPVLSDCSWPGTIPYFAATSGTSTGATKFIPVTREMIRANRDAGLALVAFHLAARPRSRIFGGRNLLLGGSTTLVERAPGVASGDLSGIAAATSPSWLRPYTFPPKAISAMTDWPEKIAWIAERAPAVDIRSIGGTPSWVLLFFDELIRGHPERGERLAAYFPNLELVVHGGVNFAPYRARFAQWLDGSHAELREAYAASEGFFAVADRGSDEGMRLIYDSGIFYEFVPVTEIDSSNPARHWLGDLEPGVDYAIVVSTCAGLWSFVVGDTVRFLSRDPPRLLVSGRLSYTLSAFGEHLIGEEVEAAIAAAAAEIGAGLRDFTVGAMFPERTGEIGGHLYLVEFERPVSGDETARFAAAIDRDLCERNLDYRDHRAGGFGLRPPVVQTLPRGAFVEWMRRRGRISGQNKVPRIIAEEALFTELRAYAAGLRQEP